MITLGVLCRPSDCHPSMWSLSRCEGLDCVPTALCGSYIHEAGKTPPVFVPYHRGGTPVPPSHGHPSPILAIFKKVV